MLLQAKAHAVSQLEAQLQEALARGSALEAHAGELQAAHAQLGDSSIRATEDVTMLQAALSEAVAAK